MWRIEKKNVEKQGGSERDGQNEGENGGMCEIYEREDGEKETEREIIDKGM